MWKTLGLAFLAQRSRLAPPRQPWERLREPPAAPVPPAVAVAAADDDLNAVLWTQRAVEHDLVLHEIYHGAEARLVPRRSPTRAGMRCPATRGRRRRRSFRRR